MQRKLLIRSFEATYNNKDGTGIGGSTHRGMSEKNGT
jgi:hypothetical protein